MFHGGAVAALAPDDPEVASRLLGLVRKELVRPSVATLPDEEAFRFRHLLIRDAAYEALPKAERAVLHERFADWLGAHGPRLVELDEILGYHLEQASRCRRELGQRSPELEGRAASHLGAAGGRAVTRQDAHAAVSLLRRAADLLPVGRDRTFVLGRLGLAYELLGRFEDAYAVVDDAIETGDDDAGAFAFFVGIVVHGHGDGVFGIESEQAIRARLDSLGVAASDVTLASGYATLALMQFWLGRIGDALGNATTALDYARRAGDRDFEHKALLIIGMAKWHGPTPWAEVLEHAGTMEALGLPSGSIRANAVAAQGRFEESRALFDEHVGALIERGARVNALGQAMGRAWFEMLAGDLGRGLDLVAPAWVELGEIGERGTRSTLGGVYADLLARAGRPDEADEVLDVVAEIGAPDDFLTASTALAARALAASARADHERAVELAREAAAIADAGEYTTQQHDVWMELGEVLFAAGRGDEAREALRTRGSRRRGRESTAVVDRIDALLGLGGSERRGLELFVRARALDELADAGLRDELSPSTSTLPRSSTISGEPCHLGALVQVVVRARVVGLGGDRHALLRVEDDDVGVGADGERALARVEPEELRRVRREQLDHPVQRDAPFADAEVVDHLQPVLEPGPAVRDLAEVVHARVLLALEEVRAVVGRDRLQHVRCARRSRARPGSPSSRGGGV